MGRPLRRHPAGQSYLVTSRCHQARFFLRPDPELNHLVLEWLTRAQQLYPSLRILAVCVLSNHLHLVVRDERSELAAWASYFLGNLSRAVNRLRKRSGPCFARRYSAEPILDAEALHDRLVYVVTNPVQAGLCERLDQWPGQVLYAAGAETLELEVEWVDRDALRRSRPPLQRRKVRSRSPDLPRVRGRLRIDPLADARERAPACEAIEARERALATRRRASGRKTLSPKLILAQHWHAAPRRPKRSPRPLCHASDPGLRRAFAEGFREFVTLFREASEQLRLGSHGQRFPEWSYPPGRPLVSVLPSAG